MTINQMLIDSRNFIKISFITSTTNVNVFKVRNRQDNQFYLAMVSNIPRPQIPLENNTELRHIAGLHNQYILFPRWVSRTDFDNLPFPMVIFDYVSDFTLNHFLFPNSSSTQLAKLDDTKKLTTISAIANAMTSIHHANIIHKHLSTSNILIDNSLQPKLFDFGLTYMQNSDNNSNQILTISPSNLAPEVIKNCQYSKASDVYSFGILVYEILTSKCPYEKKSFYEVLFQVPQGLRPNLADPNISPGFRELITKCLSPNPNDRPTFEFIESELKNNKNYILSTVNISQYLDFIKQNDVSFANSPMHPNQVNSVSFPSFTAVRESNSNLQVPPSCLYPKNEFSKLSDSCKRMVIDAESNPAKQYALGIDLIQGSNNFPQNVSLGFQYVRLASFNKYHEATVYLCRQLIRGKIIPRQLEEAKSIIKAQSSNNSDFLFLHGKLKYKQKDMKKAKSYYKKAMEAGHAEATYQYGKMLFLGIGCLKEDQQSAVKYFTEAKSRGCDKGNDFLIKFNRRLQQSPSPVKMANNQAIKQRNSVCHFAKDFNVLVVGNSEEEKISLLILLSGGEISKRGVPLTFTDTIVTQQINNVAHKFKLKSAPNDFNVSNCELINSVVLCFYLNSNESFMSLKTKWLPEVRNCFSYANILLVSLDDHSQRNQVSTFDIEGFKTSAHISTYLNLPIENKGKSDELFKVIAQTSQIKRKSSFKL